MELRKDLNEGEKEQESPNADSHLILISAGLKNCVTYVNKPKLPIYFIDLDRIYRHSRRKRLLQNSPSIPGKARSYVINDLIHLSNELMKNTQIFHSVVKKVLSYLFGPAFDVFRWKRHVTLLVASDAETGIGRIVQGTYQSPILLQHQRSDKDIRCLEITPKRFELISWIAPQ